MVKVTKKQKKTSHPNGATSKKVTKTGRKTPANQILKTNKPKSKALKKSSVQTKKNRTKRAKNLQELTRLAMLQAARRVREENKRFGEPLIVWEDGKIKEIPVGEY